MNLPSALEPNTAIRIEWLDSTSTKGWQYLKEGDVVDTTPRRVQSLGFLIALGSEALTLAHTITPLSELDSTSGHLDPLIVPLGCITAVKVLS